MELPLIGISPAIERIRSQIQEVAKNNLCVIIKGERGVGKEVVAQNLYHCSPRRGGPFIKVKFPEFSQILSESDLFGLEPFDFAKKTSHDSGVFQYADTGVYFFDEIGDMSCFLQTKLLDVLRTIGDKKSGSPGENDGLWLIAATRSNLGEKVKCGDFEEELYSRLNIFDIVVAPLRHRRQDIPLLIHHFLKQYTPHIRNRQILIPGDPEIDKLMNYRWPGNVRELQDTVKKFLSNGDWDDVIEELQDRID